MITKSLSRVGLVGAGNVLNALMGFIFLTAVAKTLDLESFGKYALLVSLLVMFSKVLDFGSNSTFVASYITQKSDALRDLFLSLKIILYFISLFSSFIALYVFNALEPLIILLFVLGLLAYGINHTLFAFFQRDERFLHIVILNSLPALIKGSFGVIILLKLAPLNMYTAFSIFSLSVISSSFMILFATKDFKKAKLDFYGLKSLITKSFPAGISGLIQEGWPALNNAITTVTNGISNVGVFSLANKISNIFVLVSFSVFTVLLPNNAKRKKLKQGYNFKETLIISFGVIAMAVTATIIAKPFVFKIFGTKFEESLGLLSILIYASAITSIHTFFENYFYVEQQTTKILAINLIKTVTLLVSAFILIPIFSLRGLAYGNLVAASSALGISYFLASRNKN